KDPIIPGVAPTTGKTSDGGGSGKRHLKHGVSGGLRKLSRPSMPQMLPYTSGILFLIADSFSKYRVGKLSMQSTINAASPTRASTFSATILSVKAVTLTCGFSSFSVCLAESALLVPILLWLCKICLLRFDQSGESKSHILMFPMPAAVRYMETGEPRPPAPAIKTVESLSFCWVSSPHLSIII